MSLISSGKGFVVTFAGEIPAGITDDQKATAFVMASFSVNTTILGMLKHQECVIVPLAELPGLRAKDQRKPS